MDIAEPNLTGDSTEVFVDWENPPSLMDLKEDVTQAQSAFNAQKVKIQGWLDNLHVRGNAAIKPRPNRSKHVPKLIRKQAEWRYPALSEPFLSTENLFDASPVSWKDKKAALQSVRVLNSQWNTKLNKVAFIDRFVKTGVDTGTAIVRLGWKYEAKEHEEELPIYEYVENPELASLHQELAQLKQEDPEQYYSEVPEELQEAHNITMQEGIPVQPVLTGYEMGIRTEVIKNQPTVEVCSYENVIIDPTCGNNFDEAKFVVYRFETTRSDLQKDGKYSNIDRISDNTSSPLSEPDATTNASGFTFKDSSRKKIWVYEYWGYWDIDGDGVVEPIVASWAGNTLIRLEENPFPGGWIPFEVVALNPTDGSIYGDPDGALLEDNQKIMGALMRGMIDIMARSANGQMGIRKDALDAVNRRRFRNGEDYEFNANVDPRQAVLTHTFSEIPISAINMMQLQQAEAEALTGVKSFSQGIGSQSLGEVAAGIRGALDAASKRETAILRRLADGLIRIGRKIMQMNAEFLDEKEVVRVTDEQFVEVRRDDLAGNYDVKLKIATAEEQQLKAQELAFMLQTMGNSLPFDMTKMILSEIARLRKMPELAHSIDNYQQQPDPMQQQMQQIEMQKLMAEVEELRSRVVENQANAQLDQAKAQNLGSDTDLKNLDYVEQESGVKQERDLQKMSAQAEAQTKMKVVEHSLKQDSELNKYLLTRK